jgi:hypothetical protein
MRLLGVVALVTATTLAPAAAAQTRTTAGQTTVTTADIQRLQDSIYEASRDVWDIRTTDASLASQLMSELDDARDEAIYLKVKLRKREPIARSEFSAVRDRVENVRGRARTDGGGRNSSVSPRVNDVDRRPSDVDRQSTDVDRRPAPASTSGRPTANEIPVGTEFDVRLQTPLSSKTSEVEDRFDATTMVDLKDDRGRVLVPAGSTMRGVVSSVKRAGRIERTGSMTVAFDRVTINGRSYPMRGTVTQALESEGIRGEAERIGIGAGAGAILGAILGGAKGALAGILIGGGGTIAATEGKDVELPVGTVLRVRFDAPLNLGSPTR